jgi:hypothetical protein
VYSFFSAADRYCFQFEITVSYLTGFLVSSVGFCPREVELAKSVLAAFGMCDRIPAAVVAAASNAITTNAVIVRCFVMGISVSQPTRFGHLELYEGSTA